MSKSIRKSAINQLTSMAASAGVDVTNVEPEYIEGVVIQPSDNATSERSDETVLEEDAADLKADLIVSGPGGCSIVRPELNTAKFADFIFPPSHSNNLKRTRSRSWQGTLPNGKTGTLTLSVHPVDGAKAPTQSTYRVLLALYDIWQDYKSKQEQGLVPTLVEDGTVVQTDSCYTSMREICEKLDLEPGGNNLTMIEREMFCLRSTILRWDHSFKNFDNKNIKVDTQNILSDYGYDKIVPKEQLFSASRVRFQFDKDIERNLISNNTRPFQKGELIGIKGEIASVLYVRLDTIMATRTKPFSRRSYALFFDDLDLGSDKYVYPSRRKAKLFPICKQLSGKKISTGETLHLKVEKTSDGKDWKLVVSKTKGKTAAVNTRNFLSIVNDHETIEVLVADIISVVGSEAQHRKLYEKYASHYSLDMISRALSEFKQEGNAAPENRVKYFNAVLHRVVHSMGAEWIKKCGKGCKYRHQLSFE